MKKEGHRTSKTRKAVIEVLEESKLPLSVSEILEQLHKTNLQVNKTTVYREIEKLLHHELIKDIYLGDEKVRYELAHRQHHHHIVCVQCKKIEDVKIPRKVESLDEVLVKQSDFALISHSLEFFGVCKECK